MPRAAAIAGYESFILSLPLIAQIFFVLAASYPVRRISLQDILLRYSRTSACSRRALSRGFSCPRQEDSTLLYLRYPNPRVQLTRSVLPPSAFNFWACSGSPRYRKLIRQELHYILKAILSSTFRHASHTSPSDLLELITHNCNQLVCFLPNVTLPSPL